MRNRIIAILLIICSFAIAPEIVQHIMMYDVYSRSIVKLVMNGGGGTGFEVEVNGTKYTVTNAHVCELADNDGKMMLISPYTRIYKVKVLAKSPYTDLCLLNGIEELPALKLGQAELKSRESVTVLGHPLLGPLKASEGIVSIKSHWISVLQDYIDSPQQENSCHEPKNRVLDFLIFKLCVVRVRSQKTTAEIEPGNSGSPVLDWRGRVRGVAFASAGGKGEAEIIPLPELKAFVNLYAHQHP